MFGLRALFDDEYLQVPGGLASIGKPQYDVSNEAINSATFGEIASLFEDHAGHITFDKRFLKKISHYVSAFVNKNEDSINFFGDALLGAYPVRYTREDKDVWFDSVLDVDEIGLRRELHSLESIVPKFKVSSDVTNHSFCWIAHKFLTSKDLDETSRREGAIVSIIMLHYKFITSWMAHNYRYPADISVARATYQALSKKFALKQHGSWAATVRARAESIISPDAIYHSTLMRYNNDLDIVDMINSFQGRNREMLKAINNVQYQIRDSDARIVSTSSTIEMDGVRQTMDKKIGWNDKLRYINSIVTSEKDFVKDQLVEVVTKAIHTVNERHLTSALSYISDNYGERRSEFIKELLDSCVVFSLNYIVENDLNIKDLVNVITKLRSIFMSSRATDPNLLELRNVADKVVSESVRSKNVAAHASARTSILLYIVLRTLTEKYYS